MKKFANIWWIFGILTIICYFFNPYIGLFSIFSIASYIITFCIIINVKSRNKKTVEKQVEIISTINEKNQILKENDAIETIIANTAKITKKYMSIISYIWIIIFGMINVFVEIIIWLLASGNLGIVAKYTTPFVLFSENDVYSASIILLMLGVLFSILTCISSFSKLRILSKEF